MPNNHNGFEKILWEAADKKKAVGSRRSLTKADYQARGVLYVPEQARYRNLLNLPEGENIGQAINEAMKAIEAENEDLKDALPKIYNRLDNDRNLLPPALSRANWRFS